MIETNQELYAALTRIETLEAENKALKDEEELTLSERLAAALSALEDVFIDINGFVLKDSVAARKTSRNWILMLQRETLLSVAGQMAARYDDPDEADEEEEDTEDADGEA